MYSSYTGTIVQSITNNGWWQATSKALLLLGYQSGPPVSSLLRVRGRSQPDKLQYCTQYCTLVKYRVVPGGRTSIFLQR